MELFYYLQQKFDRMNLILSVVNGAITDRDYEEKVIETFRQIGVDIEEFQ